MQSLAGTVRAMQHDVVSSLEISARDDWALIGALLTEWHGDSAYAFKTFYDNYNDTLTQFALFGAYVTAGFAAATKIINGTQQGVVKYAESLRDAARSQAEQWRNGYPPRDTPELPAWVVKVGEVAADAYELLDHVPVVSTGKGYIDKAVSITESVNKIANDLGIDGDISLLPHEERPFKATTADELYADATDTLHTDHHQAYDTAMDQLYSGNGATDPDHADDVPFSGQGVESLLQSLKDRYDWGLPEVPPGSLYEPGDRGTSARGTPRRRPPPPRGQPHPCRHRLLAGQPVLDQVQLGLDAPHLGREQARALVGQLEGPLLEDPHQPGPDQPRQRAASSASVRIAWFIQSPAATSSSSVHGRW